MKRAKSKPHTRPSRSRPEPSRHAAWEPPTLRVIGTISELVQATKRSGKQDCGGQRRNPGTSC